MSDRLRSSGYVPDPAAETAMLIDAFFRASSERFPEEFGLEERLRDRHERLVTQQQDRVVDEPSRHNLAMTLAVLAAYQELIAQHEEGELLPALHSAFVQPLEPFVRTATRTMLDQATDPFATMVALTRDREQQSFGAGFAFTHPEDDPEQFTSQVERCFYHDVLRANDAEKLTPVFCAFDANWIDAIDPDRDGFEFERPTTIGTGGSCCPFRFRRTPGTPT
ncbi:MAG: L-2-amino-thiazoline-4-carboxylic acid hydrolase [Solirubrobacterales bacterium]|nr:L-2-amino-thiazoline-4-carboxylic acid hydrolase [Solirubrobacterales bacterium]MBV9799889.1 L-2-amino-thiazoline-4-carboxylic acid hydrolase [Solirubrobacterales bacterium]